jgi:hypothetical protein
MKIQSDFLMLANFANVISVKQATARRGLRGEATYHFKTYAMNINVKLFMNYITDQKLTRIIRIDNMILGELRDGN